VLLDRTVWDRVAALEGDRGFGPFFESHPELLQVIDVPGANPDVDTPADLHSLEDAR
jgi:CTP:molybdopterin cytidylyltransferase MocA